jgi:hypothetical protein
MPIQTGDIKLLKPQVLLDTPDGGGAMTANEVVDGVSNNLFPDVSSVNRTFGNFRLREVFVAVLTSTTDNYFSSNVIVSKLPADPLTNVAIFKISDVPERRDAAKTAVERYLAKGPRWTCRIMETHYQGGLVLQLLSTTGDDFPKGGDAVVIRTSTGQEQFVRILKTAVRTQSFTIQDSTGVVTFTGFVCSASLGQALQYDVDGPPIGRAVGAVATYASLYSTVVASGARFYSTKPLASAAALGARTLHVPDVYTALVPATTAESALVDQYPLGLRASLSRTGYATLTLTPFSVNLGPNTSLQIPTAAEPRTVSVTHNGTVFTDDGAGNLLQGTTTVGSIDYAQRSITLLASAPSFGNGSVTIAYKPATASGAATHSDSLTVTQANQGLVFTAAFEPVPAPGSLAISYMVQGNWYTLIDNGNGKLAGLDSSYGTGTVSYTTGSVSVTLGALPDVGSDIIYLWGDAAAARAVPLAKLPAGLSTVLPLPSNFKTLTLAWARGASSFSAALTNGALTCSPPLCAVGKVTATGLLFSPTTLPDGPVSLTVSTRTPGTVTTASSSLVFPGTRLAHININPYTVRFNIQFTPLPNFNMPTTLPVVDDGNGTLVTLLLSDGSYGTPLPNSGIVVGTVNYATGSFTVNATASMDTNETVTNTVTSPGDSGRTFTTNEPRVGQVVNILQTGYTVAYTWSTADVTTSSTTSVTPTDWALDIPVDSKSVLLTGSLAFTLGSTLYFGREGALSAGWVSASGAPATPNAGSITSQGRVLLSQLPADGNNTTTWLNAAVDTATGFVSRGVFRTASAPLKIGVMQLQVGAQIGNADATGAITGGGFGGAVDYLRGIVRWTRTQANAGGGGGGNVAAFDAAAASGASLSYNAVYLQFLPLDQAILGVDTARLPLDGRVPIYRTGDMLVVHHTALTPFPGTPFVGQVLNVGRVRLSSLRVLDSTGAVLDPAMFTADLDAGSVTLKSNYALGSLVLPLSAEHRIEDQAVMTDVQISGQIKLNQALTHSYPAGDTLVSSALMFGDLQARVHTKFEQATWSNAWSDSLIGADTVAQFNDALYPITTTNKGALQEQWALIFTNNTAYRVIGRTVGQIATGDTANACAPINPATTAPYFSIPALGWGSGWSAGNVLRFNTAAANAPFWVARTILQGPSAQINDSFQLQLRGDIDRP